MEKWGLSTLKYFANTIRGFASAGQSSPSSDTPSGTLLIVNSRFQKTNIFPPSMNQCLRDARDTLKSQSGMLKTQLFG